LYRFYARQQHKQRSWVASKQPYGSIPLIGFDFRALLCKPGSPVFVHSKQLSNIFEISPGHSSNTAQVCLATTFDRPKFTPTIRNDSQSGQTHIFHFNIWHCDSFLKICRTYSMIWSFETKVPFKNPSKFIVLFCVLLAFMMQYPRKEVVTL
jgi:hypothetical protein